MKRQTNAGMSCLPHLQVEQPSVLITKIPFNQSFVRLAPARQAFFCVIGLKGWRENKQPEENSVFFFFLFLFRNCLLNF